MSLASRTLTESTADYEDATGMLHPGDWKEVATNQLHSMRPAGVSGSNDATRIRDQFKNYFSSEIGRLCQLEECKGKLLLADTTHHPEIAKHSCVL